MSSLQVAEQSRDFDYDDDDLSLKLKSISFDDFKICHVETDAAKFFDDLCRVLVCNSSKKLIYLLMVQLNERVVASINQKNNFARMLREMGERGTNVVLSKRARLLEEDNEDVLDINFMGEFSDYLKTYSIESVTTRIAKLNAQQRKLTEANADTIDVNLQSIIQILKTIPSYPAPTISSKGLDNETLGSLSKIFFTFFAAFQIINGKEIHKAHTDNNPLLNVTSQLNKLKVLVRYFCEINQQ